ncbi:hypothetical protein HN020_09345 [Brevibacillus borstelensis]|uniref:hypothetical protein n=1 Tax=Brevibacillus borstelensis TaxID=45462 RepID=UPI00149088EF|nr:hypothetical protein [Brevibacillus borstelensis]NOU54952.1 hypothetical protein [Brevibacillus borstelensis]
MNAAAKLLERTYMTKSRRTRYIACEEYDFTWSDDELKRFREMWRKGLHILDISKEMQRHRNEVAILIIDQSERGYIQPRKGGVFGTGVDTERKTRERVEDEQPTKAQTSSTCDCPAKDS